MLGKNLGRLTLELWAAKLAVTGQGTEVEYSTYHWRFEIFPRDVLAGTATEVVLSQVQSE
jgi:hypothetical protein